MNTILFDEVMIRQKETEKLLRILELTSPESGVDQVIKRIGRAATELVNSRMWQVYSVRRDETTYPPALKLVRKAFGSKVHEKTADTPSFPIPRASRCSFEIIDPNQMPNLRKAVDTGCLIRYSSPEVC